jgi:cysteine desulfurase
LKGKEFALPKTLAKTSAEKKSGPPSSAFTVYLDHNATTPVDQLVREAMLACLSDDYANPSSLHAPGRKVKAVLRECRSQVASIINASPEEMIFTSGGTESINLAVKGILLDGAGGHIITSVVEHPATLRTCEYLSNFGVETTFLPVDQTGMISPEDVSRAIRPDTRLISLMLANNEVGTISPLEDVGAIAERAGIPFHIDAVQAIGKIPVDVKRLNCTFLSMSAHKIYGPKGVGALFIRKGTKLNENQHGGGQEAHLRAGTENVPGIVGFAKACEIARTRLPDDIEHLLKLRSILLRLQDDLPAVRLNGHPTKTLPGTVNLCFLYVDGMALLLNLSLKGIFVSTGSACSVATLKPSHVLLAMGMSEQNAYSSLRLSLGRGNTEEQIEYTVQQISNLVAKLRLVTAPEDIGQCGPDCPCYFS